MIKHYPFNSLGKADHGWLKANHHFSFASYYNPKRMDFGVLRVINDDWIQAGKGFPAHPHNNMEIITFVRTGAISHQDSEGNEGITRAGQVQVMSAGSGIVHSEYNREDTATTLYQIWIETNRHNVTPRWETKQFSDHYATDKLPLLVSGFEEDKNSALYIHQKAKIYAGKMKKGMVVEQKIINQAYVLASKGKFELIIGGERHTMEKGDGAELTQVTAFSIRALSDCEVVVIDAPSYKLS